MCVFPSVSGHMQYMPRLVPSPVPITYTIQGTFFTPWEVLSYQCLACLPTNSYILQGSLTLSFFSKVGEFNISAGNEAEKLVFVVLRGTADWFGVSKDGDATQRWQRKSLRHCSLRYGKLKPQVIREMDLPSQDNISLTSTETPPPLYVPSSQHGMQKVKGHFDTTCLKKPN